MSTTTSAPMQRATQMGHILVVDDDADLCQLMVKLFKRFGHHAECENNGPSALARLESMRPHVILLDMMMPEMTGIDVLRELRANAATAGIPVVMFSALSDAQTRKDALSLGANDYFVKASVDFGQMMQRLAKYLPEQ